MTRHVAGRSDRVSVRSELAEALRLCASLPALYRVARVEAEALVWHCDSDGVAIARTREAQSLGAQRPRDWLVRHLAERRCDLLHGVDIGTRYELGAEWTRRPGQMIVRAGPGKPTSAGRARRSR